MPIASSQQRHTTHIPNRTMLAQDERSKCSFRCVRAPLSAAGVVPGLCLAIPNDLERKYESIDNIEIKAKTCFIARTTAFYRRRDEHCLLWLILAIRKYHICSTERVNTWWHAFGMCVQIQNVEVASRPMLHILLSVHKKKRIDPEVISFLFGIYVAAPQSLAGLAPGQQVPIDSGYQRIPLFYYFLFPFRLYQLIN